MPVRMYHAGGSPCQICGETNTHWHSRLAGGLLAIKPEVSEDTKLNFPIYYSYKLPSTYRGIIQTKIETNTMPSEKPITVFNVLCSMIGCFSYATTAIAFFHEAWKTQISTPTTFAEWFGSSLAAGISLIVTNHYFWKILDQRQKFNAYNDGPRYGRKIADCQYGKGLPNTKQSYTLHPSIRARFSAWRNKEIS